MGANRGEKEKLINRKKCHIKVKENLDRDGATELSELQSEVSRER